MAEDKGVVSFAAESMERRRWVKARKHQRELAPQLHAVASTTAAPTGAEELAMTAQVQLRAASNDLRRLTRQREALEQELRVCPALGHRFRAVLPAAAAGDEPRITELIFGRAELSELTMSAPRVAAAAATAAEQLACTSVTFDAACQVVSWRCGATLFDGSLARDGVNTLRVTGSDRTDAVFVEVQTPSLPEPEPEPEVQPGSRREDLAWQQHGLSTERARVRREADERSTTRGAVEFQSRATKPPPPTLVGAPPKSVRAPPPSGGSLAKEESQRRKLRKLQRSLAAAEGTKDARLGGHGSVTVPTEAQSEQLSGLRSAQRHAAHEEQMVAMQQKLQVAERERERLEQERIGLVKSIEFPGLGRQFVAMTGDAEVPEVTLEFGAALEETVMLRPEIDLSQASDAADAEEDGHAAEPNRESCVGVVYDAGDRTLRWRVESEMASLRAGTATFTGQLGKTGGRNVLHAQRVEDGAAFTFVEVVAGADKDRAVLKSELTWQLRGRTAEEEIAYTADMARLKERAQQTPGAWGSTNANRASRGSLSQQAQGVTFTEAAPADRSAFDETATAVSVAAPTEDKTTTDAPVSKFEKLQAALSEQLHEMKEAQVPFKPDMPSDYAKEYNREYEAAAAEWRNKEPEPEPEPELEPELEPDPEPAVAGPEPEPEPEPEPDGDTVDEAADEVVEGADDETPVDDEQPADDVELPVEEVGDEPVDEPEAEEVDEPAEEAADDAPVDDEPVEAEEAVVDDPDVTEEATVEDGELEPADGDDGYGDEGFEQPADENDDNDDGYGEEFETLEPDDEGHTGPGVTFAVVETLGERRAEARRLKQEEKAQARITRAQVKLQTLERHRQIAETEAAAIQRWELAQLEQEKMVALRRAERKRKAATDAARVTKHAARLARASAALAGVAEEEVKRRKARAVLAAKALRESQKEEEAAEAAAERAAAIARWEESELARVKKIAARENRKAAAARVVATRLSRTHEEKKCKKQEEKEERERKAARKARVREHVDARRLMEEKWEVAKAEMRATAAPLAAAEKQESEAGRVATKVVVAPVSAEQKALRQRAADLLSELPPPEATPEVEEEEREQMERNADNIDFEALDEKGSILTLLKYTLIPHIRSVLCIQLEHICSSEEELPEPEQQSALLTRLLELEEDGSCPTESAAALQAAMAWPKRVAEQRERAVAEAAAAAAAEEELHVLTEQLARIAAEREALEAEAEGMADAEGVDLLDREEDEQAAAEWWDDDVTLMASKSAARSSSSSAASANRSVSWAAPRASQHRAPPQAAAAGGWISPLVPPVLRVVDTNEGSAAKLPVRMSRSVEKWHGGDASVGELLSAAAVSAAAAAE